MSARWRVSQGLHLSRLSTKKRFYHLEIEEFDECVIKKATVTEPQIITDAAKYHVINASVASTQSDHDFLRKKKTNYN